MGFEQDHEPAAELRAGVRKFPRMIASLTEGAEAIAWYQQRARHVRRLSPDPPIDPRRAANGCYFEPEIHGGHATEGRRRPASTRAGPIVGRRTDPRRAEEPVMSRDGAGDRSGEGGTRDGPQASQRRQELLGPWPARRQAEVEPPPRVHHTPRHAQVTAADRGGDQGLAQ